MPGSIRDYTYVLTPTSEDMKRVLAQARKVMGWYCENEPRITNHAITGEALGLVTLTMTIHSRDQWASRQLAQDVLNYVTWGLKNTGATQMDLQSWRQEVHMNRGYAHGRTKRFREKKKTEPEAPPST